MKHVKHALMLVCSQAQLLLAMQIRRYMLADCKVDIILSTEKMRHIYDNKSLESMFEQVYFVEEKGLKCYEKIFAFFNPAYGIKKYANIFIQKYSDVFFWNTGWILYYLFKYFVLSPQKWNWHLISDASGSYVVELPEFYKMYGSTFVEKILNWIDFHLYKYGNLSKWGYDIYLSSSRFVMYQTKANLVEVPIFDIKDKEYIAYVNKVFEYKHEPIQEEIIFLDTACDGYYDERVLLKVLNDLANCVGEKKIAIKMHPRDSVEKYRELETSMTVIGKNMAWELFCINGGIKDKIVIGYIGSTIVLPYAFLGLKQKVFILEGVIKYNELYKDFEKRHELLHRAIAKENPLFKIVSSVEEIKELI